MGFLDSLCDYDDGEAEVSWGSFWRIENLCALTTLGAVVPLLFAGLTCVAVTVLWARSSSTTSTTRNKTYHRQLNINDPAGGTSSSTEGGGFEESKNSSQQEDNNGFAASASEPLLGNHRAATNGDLSRDLPSEYGELPGDAEGRGTPKKGTGVHWLKLLLYWFQISYHLGVALADLVDGHADDPYKCEFMRVLQ